MAIAKTLDRKQAKPANLAKGGFFDKQKMRLKKMTNNEIEKEIQEKGLTAPRVTPDQLEGVIVSEQYYIFPNSTFTACLLTLQNGYTVLGESACASPENFNTDLGRKIARDNAKNKIWALEGYLLRSKLNPS
jgi:hypothetical protein